MSDDPFAWLLNEFKDEAPKTSRRDWTRSPLIFPGSKFESLPHLEKYIKPRAVFLDHFCGSGVVSFNIGLRSSSHVVMNDANSAIATFMTVIKDSVQNSRLVAFLDGLPSSREIWEVWREQYPNTDDPVIRSAMWFYVLVFSSQGHNSAFGRNIVGKWNNKLPGKLAQILALPAKMNKIIIENDEFSKTMTDYDRHDAVHYFDPPYLGTDINHYGGAFDQKKLRFMLDTIGTLKGDAYVSYRPDGLLDSYPYWTDIKTWEVTAPAGAGKVRTYTEALYIRCT